MSFAMDDLGMSYGIDPALQTKLAEETRKVDKTADVKPSDSPQKEPEVNDVFESTQQKQDLVKTTFETVQEESTAIDITNEALNKLSSYVADIKKSIESDENEESSGKKIDENYEKINQVARETSFNDTKLIEESENKISLKEMQIPDIKDLKIDTPEQKEESVKKLDDILNNIKNKEQELLVQQEEITQRINKNSLIELKVASASEKEVEIEVELEKEIKKEEADSAEKLKESTIKDINDAPKKSIKMHIQHLDRNLLLAMLSLRSA
ncbi:MAG TPA: hypothetical protein DDW90_01320 [Cyanobacteria bacterium UBA9971]|nr:hypothetical protein [Cyanobacteria bacterium UBA9971]